MFLGYDYHFWLSVIAASFVKFFLGERHSVWHAMATAFVGIWAAWTFTIPFVDYWSLASETYTIGVAGTLALTGNGLARMALTITQDPKSFLSFFRELVQAWKGEKS